MKIMNLWKKMKRYLVKMKEYVSQLEYIEYLKELTLLKRRAS